MERMKKKRLLLLVFVFVCLLSGCEKEESHEKATLVWEDADINLPAVKNRIHFMQNILDN